MGCPVTPFGVVGSGSDAHQCPLETVGFRYYADVRSLSHVVADSPFTTATLAAATVGTGGGDFALFVDDKNGTYRQEYAASSNRATQVLHYRYSTHYHHAHACIL